MQLDFTGERIVPGKVDDLLLAEHVARYRYVAQLTPGRKVLDVACGVGYGSRILRRGGAESVVAFDLAVNAARYASEHFGGDGCHFLAADSRLMPFPSGSFDHVTFFEAVEHIEQAEEVLAEAARVLTPEGLIFISTPNSRIYRKQLGEQRNPYHVVEYDLDEFRELLAPHFPHVHVLGQVFTEAVRFSTVAGDRELPPEPVEGLLEESGGGRSEPDYLLAVCAKQASSLDAVREVVLRSPYNVLAYFRDAIRELERDLNEKRAWAVRLNHEIEILRQRYAAVEEELAKRSAWAMSLQHRLSEAELKQAPGTVEEVTELEADTLEARLESIEEMAGERPRVLIVASGSPEESLAALQVMAEKVTPGALHCFVGSEKDWILRDYCTSRDLPFLALDLGVTDLKATAAALRDADFHTTAMLMTRHGSRRRLKLLGMMQDRSRLIVFNENRDFFGFTRAALARHLSWRGRESLRRGGQWVAAGANLLRSQGLRGFTRRLGTRMRVGKVGRTASRWRLKAANLRLGPVELPQHDDPMISIVIPARDQWSFTLHCLKSIADNTRAPFEVVLVDNASADATRRAEERVSGLRVVRLAENQGFVGACNAGMREARGRYVLFLNNDVVTTPGWLEPLIQVFDRVSGCGAVGSKLLYPDGRLQEAGGIVWKGGTAWNYGKNDSPELPEYCYLRQVDYCSGAALMVRRDLLLELGGFSEEFSPGYWEDADLCFTLRACGFSVWLQPQSVLYHFEGASSGRREDQGMKRFQRINAATFRRKWQAQLEEQIELDPRNLFLARDRNRNPTVLVVDHYVPTFDRDAGSAFMYRLLRTLGEIGYRVIFWPDNRFNTPYYTDRLQERGIEVRYGAQELDAYLRDHGRFLDHAIVYRSSIAEPYLEPLRRHVSSIAYIAVDLEHVREGRRSEVEALDPALVETLRQREGRIVSMVDCVAAHSPVELDLLHQEFAVPRDSMHLLPLPVLETEVTSRGFDERRDLAFVGSTHPPNVDAVIHFVREVLPAVRRQLGDVRLRVVGEVCGCLGEVKDEPGVELCGYVDDLVSVLDEVRVFVAPLRYGAGIKGKILTAMAMGVPVVTSSMGAEGIDLRAGRDAVVADSPEEMAAATVALYTDGGEWARQRQAGLDWVASSVTDEDFRTRVEQFMNSLQRCAARPMPGVSSEENRDVAEDPEQAVATGD